MLSHTEIFGRIYHSNAWYAGSGPGSQPYLAQAYTNFISGYVRKHRIKHILDIGCGDGQLYRQVNWHGARYMGMDVVDFGDHYPPGRFVLGDVRDFGDMSQSWAQFTELVLIKDVLQHWGNAEIGPLLPWLQQFPRVLITNSAAGWHTNSDIETGWFRSLDLAAEPFCWPVVEVFCWQGDEPKSVVELRPSAAPRARGGPRGGQTASPQGSA